MKMCQSLLSDMLRFMADQNASDLHLSVGVPPYIRVNGRIIATQFPALTKEECENLVFDLMSEEEKQEYDRDYTVDFSFGQSDIGCFRVNAYQQRGTIAAAIRRLPIDVPSLDQLGLPLAPMMKFCNLTRGLLLVCGPVGSGKTTTLAAMINFINKTRACHVISIEDPIEYVHKNVKSMVHQREVRKDTPNFYDALKFILREDPDIVVIGEMRDLETISSALTIAETGHLVLATLHTGDTSESVRRIIDIFPAGQQTQIAAQLSYILVGVVNQALIAKSDATGRILSTEVMVVTPAIQNLIRENKIEQIYSQIQLGQSLGMRSMSQSLADLVQKGVITYELALTKTTKPRELDKLLGKAYA